MNKKKRKKKKNYRPRTTSPAAAPISTQAFPSKAKHSLNRTTKKSYKIQEMWDVKGRVREKVSENLRAYGKSVSKKKKNSPAVVVLQKYTKRVEGKRERERQEKL